MKTTPSRSFRPAASWRQLCLAGLGTAALALPSISQGAPFFWTGDANSFWNNTGGANGTNWSSSGDFNNGTPGLPGAADDVFFNLFGAGNLNTILGANFSIRSLSFTPDATSSVTIGGANTLTLGVGGLTNNSTAAHTLSTAVTLGANQTWTNNTATPVTVSGGVGGGSNLTLAGNGAFVFTGANGYSGTTSLSTVGATLTLSGANGSLATSSVSLEGGTTLRLDSSAGNHASNNRIGDTVGISSRGGTLELLGTGTTTETVGTLTLTTGLTRVNVDAGATLTFGSGALQSFNRSAGSSVNFSSTGTIKAPLVTLTNGIIGGWATIGNPDSNSGANILDFATVDGSGNIVSLATYALNDFTLATNNVKVDGTGAPIQLAADTTINSLYLTGGARIGFGGNGTRLLTIGTGGIISNAATVTLGAQNQPDITTAAVIGNPTINASQQNGPEPLEGQITSSGPDLIVTTASNLRINARIVGNIGLTKNGSGLLDLSNGNNQNVAGRPVNTYTGNTTINGGILFFNDDLELGAVPGAYTADKITLNGGEMKTTRGITLAANRGITLGPQGGTISYNGGATFTIGNNTANGNKIVGSGQVTFSSIPVNANTNTMVLNFAAGTNTYQGATTLNTQRSTSQRATIQFGQNEQIPDGSAVTLTGDPGNDVNAGVNLNGRTETIGSLASAEPASRIFNHTATLTIGQNNLSTTYAGRIQGTNGVVTKVGSGALTFSGNNTYTGVTNIHGGTLFITGSPSSSGLVNVGNAAGTLSGTLGGTGTVAAPVVVHALGHLAPALLPGTTATLTIANDLTLNAGSTLDYNFGALGTPGTSDLVDITGAGNLLLNAGNDVLNITALPGFGIGTYNLITVSGSGTFTNNATFTINGTSLFNYSILNPGATIDATAGGGVVPAGQLRLQVLAGNPNFFWTGAVNGTWDINATNNWTGAGPKFTNGGNVTFDDVNLSVVPPGATNITVIGGGVSPNTMVFNNALNNYTFGGGPITVVAGAGVTKSQAGTVTFNNTVTTPITAINAGTFNVGTGATYNSTTKVDVNGGILGVSGALNTPNLTVKTGGTLNVAPTGSLGASTALVVNAAANFNNAAQTVASLTDTAGATTGVVTLNGTALTVTGTSTYNGTIVGTGSLVKNTGGAFTLSNGLSTYSGGTTITGGTLVTTNATGSATGSGLVTIANTGTLAGTRIGGSLVAQSGSTFSPGTGTPLTGDVGTFNVDGAITIDAGSTLDFDLAAAGNGDTVVAGGAVTFNVGAITLNIFENVGFGVGSYTLFTGASLVNNATFTINPSGPGLVFGNYDVQAVGNSLILNFSPVSLTWTGGTNGNWDTTTVGNWTPVTTFGNGAAVAFDDSGANTTITVDAGGVVTSGMTFSNSVAVPYDISGGPIAGAGGLTKTNTGVVTLSGENTFSGSTSITGGTVSISSDANLGTAPVAATADHLVLNGATLAATGSFTLNANRGLALGNGVGTVSVAAGSTVTYDGIAANVTGQAGILTKTGDGELILGGANTFTGGTNVNTGILRINNGGAAGTGTLTVNPSGALSLGASLSATTPLVMAGGTVGIAGGAARNIDSDLTAATGTTSTVALFDPATGGGRFDLIVLGVLHGSGNLNVEAPAGDVAPEGGGFRLRGANSPDYTGTITVGNSVKFELEAKSASGSGAGTGTLVFTAGTIDNGTNGTYTLINLRNNSGGNTVLGNNVQIAGTGTTLLNLINGGGSAINPPPLPPGSTTTFGTLQIGAGQTLAASAVNTSVLQTVIFGTVTLTGGEATFQPGIPGNFNYTVQDNITLGPVGESVAGSGLIANGLATLKLTGNSSYTGTTTVATGTLQVGDGGTTGTLGSGAVTNDATIRFNRSDTLTVANAITGTGTVTNAGGASNVLNLNGAQDYGTLNADSGTTNVNGSFTNGTAVVNANATLNFTTSQTLGELNIGAVALVSVEDLTPFAGAGKSVMVPEPGTIGLLLVGALGVLARRRRA